MRSDMASVPPVQWIKLSPDKRDANEMASRAITGTGGAASYTIVWCK